MSLTETYKTINLTSIIYALIGSHSQGNYQRNIVNGRFRCTDDEYYEATKVLDYLTTLMPIIKSIKGKRVSLCNAIIFCYKTGQVDMNRIEKQLINMSNNINGIVDMETALSELERIYNYGIKKKENNVYLVTEWKKSK